MCGIAGEMRFGGPVDEGVIRGMADALVHRGPDDQGSHCEANVGLAHRRLSIIDLSPAGRQPIWSDDRSLAVVFNGEVYNYKELRADLEAEGCRFAGDSDTEVAVNAIRRWGLEPALRRFIGMFAFALWDRRDRSLTLVRDRVGVKPLYYQKTPERMIFGSELKALYAHPAFRRELASAGLRQFFCFGYTLGETTVFRDTYKLPAGHYLRVAEDGACSLTRYWSLESVSRGSFGGSFEEAGERLAELCDSAFRYRLVSDVPVGIFLSGGIDSTFLAGWIKTRLGADLEHITIGFDSAAYDEAPKAAQVARKLGLRHTVRMIDSRDGEAALRRFVEIWDEPFGDTSGIPTSILCSLARERVKVALSADGGDELFCGYDSYPAYDSRYRLQRVPLGLRRFAASLARRLPYRWAISAGLTLRPSDRWNPQTGARFEKALDVLEADGPAGLTRVMNEKGWTAGTVEALVGLGPDGDVPPPFGRQPKGAEDGLCDHFMRSDFSAFLGEDILTKVDRASMAASLECRDPLLDHRLVEFAFSLPLDYVYDDGLHKRLLRSAMASWTPPEVLESPKRGFSVPLYHWLRGPWKGMVTDYLSDDAVRRTGVLDPSEVKRALDDFYRFRGGRAEKIFLMLNFQMWAERWLSR